MRILQYFMVYDTIFLWIVFLIAFKNQLYSSLLRLFICVHATIKEPLAVRSSVHPSVCPSVGPFVHPSVGFCARLYVRRFVRPSVHLSVCPFVRHIWLFWGLCGFWSYCSCPNKGLASNMAPAHPHTTSVALYQALFSTNISNFIILRLCNSSWLLENLVIISCSTTKKV